MKVTDKIVKRKFEPAKEIKRWMDDGVVFIEYEYPPLYEASQLLIFDNPFGLSPDKINGKRRRAFREFDLWAFRSGEYQREKRKLSGENAIIYALVNPIDNSPFYIGSTKITLSKRLRQHVRGRYRCNNHNKNSIIKEILSQKQKPIIFELCHCPVEFQFIEERRWIMGAKKTHKISNIQ